MVLNPLPGGGKNLSLLFLYSAGTHFVLEEVPGLFGGNWGYGFPETVFAKIQAMDISQK